MRDVFVGRFHGAASDVKAVIQVVEIVNALRIHPGFDANLPREVFGALDREDRYESL
ncbi:MAG: hypothetical protein ABSG91_18780 [Syntrophobacteraceae bacterium]